MAGHEHEVGERPDVVDAARVLGDPERVEDRRVALARVLARGRADVLGRDAGDPLRLLGRVARDDLAHRVEVLGVLADVLLVLQPLLEDHVHHRVHQPDVRARPQLQVALRELRQPDLPRVGDDERRAVPHRLLHPQREHRVRLGRVRADHEQEAVVLDLGDRVGAGSSAQRPDQAVKSRSVSGGFAGVDRVASRSPSGRASGCRKFSSIVSRADARKPIDCGPCCSFTPCRPVGRDLRARPPRSVACSSPSSPRTSGSVSRSGWWTKLKAKRPLTQRLPSFGDVARVGRDLDDPLRLAGRRSGRSGSRRRRTCTSS